MQLLDCATTAFSERYSSAATRTVNPRWMNLILFGYTGSQLYGVNKQEHQRHAVMVFIYKHAVW